MQKKKKKLLGYPQITKFLFSLWNAILCMLLGIHWISMKDVLIFMLTKVLPKKWYILNI